MDPRYDFDRVTEHCYLGDITTRSVYSGYLHRQWAAGGVTLGGYMASVMMKVTMQRYPGRYPISMNTFFVNPGTTAPFIVELETIKASDKGMCTFVVKLKQRRDADSNMTPLDRLDTYHDTKDDYLIKNFAVISLSGTRPERGFSQHRQGSLDVIYKPSPIESLVQLPAQCEGDETLKMYHDITKNDSKLHYAFEFSDGRSVDNLAIVYFFDMYADPLGSLMNKNVDSKVHGSWKPTLQYEIQFKRPITTPMRRAYLCYEVCNVIHGRWDMDGCIYDEQGELLATTRHQLRIIPRKTKQVSASSNESKL